MGPSYECGMLTYLCNGHADHCGVLVITVYRLFYLHQVMFVGSSNARNIIKEHEFYHPKSKNIKKKKSGQVVGESKQERIKFDVLLTSYEMINMDTVSLKAIEWECMVRTGHFVA